MENEGILTQFENLLREVDAMYLVYRNNREATAPMAKRRQLERLYNMLRNTNFSSNVSNYKKTNLLQRYNIFIEKWEKMIDEREFGIKRGTKIEYSEIKQKDAEYQIPDSVSKETTRRAEPEGDSLYRKLYTEFKNANERIGKRVANFEKFKDYLQSMEDSIKKKTKAKSIDFVIKIEDGKPSLKAKIKKSEEI